MHKEKKKIYDCSRLPYDIALWLLWELRSLMSPAVWQSVVDSEHSWWGLPGGGEKLDWSRNTADMHPVESQS